MGFSRQEYWSGLPFPPPGDLPSLGIEPESPALAGGFFPRGHLGSPSFMTVCSQLSTGSFGSGAGTANRIQGQTVRATGWLLERIQRQSELPLREPKASIRSTDFRSHPPAEARFILRPHFIYYLFCFFVFGHMPCSIRGP